MNRLEHACVTLRHARVLRRMGLVWKFVRPAYDVIVGGLGRHGLERLINQTDRVLVDPGCRGVTEVFEPDVWKRLMTEVRPGDRIADVGAHIGIYSTALAKRVGCEGRVFAFEPDPANNKKLHRNIGLNQLHDHVDILEVALGDCCGVASFLSDLGYESRVSAGGEVGSLSVYIRTLDDVFRSERLDILKIDVEGYEELVLRGGVNLLGDLNRRPRAIFIEVHPGAWAHHDTTSESLLALLRDHGYRVETLEGTRVDAIDSYGEIVALSPGIASC